MTNTIPEIEGDATKFVDAIEALVETRGLTYMEAIIEHCEAIELEFDVVAKLLDKNIKKKLKEEAQYLNMLKEKRGGQLPI